MQKRGKRRWIFKKPLGQETIVTHQISEGRTINTTAAAAADITAIKSNNVSEVSDHQRHAIEVAMATAQAAVASAQAAVEAVRLSRPSSMFIRSHYAATTIQTAFRGYLVIKYRFIIITCLLISL